MAWLYVPALGDSSLPCSLPSAIPTTPSATWRGKPLSSLIWSREWKKGGFVRRLSGTTLTPSTADRGVASFIASLPGSPVSPSLSPAPGWDLKMNVGCGPASRESFATFDPTSSGWKTSRPSLFTDSLTSSDRWPSSGILQRGICFPLPTSARPTVESDGSFSQWRTPDSPGAGGPRTHTTSQGKGHQVTLQEQATNWATPTGHDVRSGKGTQKRVGTPALNEQVDKWPTPAAANGHGGVDVMNPGTSLTDAMRSHSSLLAQQTSTPGGECLPTDPTLHRQWPTPTAQPYGSSQNGINGKGGEFERPSAGTPSLERQAKNLQSDLWKTPHGMANTDKHGKTGGAGGEHQSQVMKATSLHALTNQGDGTSPATASTPKDSDSSAPKAQLNPLFDEWLMGWPLGWTDFALAATEWFRWKRRMRSALSRLVLASRSGPRLTF